MPTIRLNTIIGAPPGTVFSVLSDWRQRPRWERELRQYAPITPEPFGAGTRIHWVRALGAGQISGIVDITECDPPRLLVSEAPTGPMRFRTVARLAATVDGTQTILHAELTVKPHGALRLLTPLVIRNVRRQATGNLQALKDLVEQAANTQTPS